MDVFIVVYFIIPILTIFVLPTLSWAIGTWYQNRLMNALLEMKSEGGRCSKVTASFHFISNDVNVRRFFDAAPCEHLRRSIVGSNLLHVVQEFVRRPSSLLRCRP